MLTMTERHYDNKRELKERRRELRRSMTPAEQKLWQCLRGKQLGGYRFQRQYSLDWYILDFYCHERKLAIEADGYHHDLPEQSQHDLARTQFLNARGIRVLRFWNHEILNDTQTVLNQILTALASPHPISHNSPLTKGGEVESSPSPAQIKGGSIPTNPNSTEAKP